MVLPSLSAVKVANLLATEAITLVDVREAGERQRQHINGSLHLPLSRLAEAVPGLATSGTVVFHCASGARTGMQAARLAERVPGCTAMVLGGGIGGWVAAGLPVVSAPSVPLIQRLRRLLGGG
jgi:rhodanese-related sulfurtransferase